MPKKRVKHKKLTTELCLKAEIITKRKIITISQMPNSEPDQRFFRASFSKNGVVSQSRRGSKNVLVVSARSRIVVSPPGLILRGTRCSLWSNGFSDLDNTNAHFMVNDFFARILVGVYIVKFGVPGMQQEFAID